MDDRIQGRRYEDRHIPASAFQKNAENESAEKCFLDNRDNGCGGRNLYNCRPIDRAAAEEGSGREDEACEHISPSMRISRELQIIQAADFQRSNEWPKQNHGGYEQRAMKECFEIVSREKSQKTVSNEGLSAPKKTRRQQRADKNRREQINQESGRILQGC